MMRSLYVESGVSLSGRLSSKGQRGGRTRVERLAATSTAASSQRCTHQQQSHHHQQQSGSQYQASHCDRRQLLGGLAVAGAALPLLAALPASASLEGTQVGSYLPPAGVDDLVLFVPDAKKTPAIRAGTVSPDTPYRFALPPTWREAKVANILSGNYCQPRCGEPWVEVIFENEAEGRAQVIVSPLVRLTNRKGVAIEDIGPPEGLITSLGPFITGTYLDEEDVVASSSERRDDGLTYYTYDINAPYGSVGPHTVSAATVKGDLALLMVVSANEKQWARNEAKLRKIASTFTA